MNQIRKAYMLLRTMAADAGIAVHDTEHDCAGVTIDRRINERYFPAPYVIAIGRYRSMKKRMFVLAHELGHCTVLKETDDGEFYLELLKQTVGETKANMAAMNMLSYINRSWPKEFIKMYQTEKAKRRRKW